VAADLLEALTFQSPGRSSLLQAGCWLLHSSTGRTTGARLGKICPGALPSTQGMLAAMHLDLDLMFDGSSKRRSDVIRLQYHDQNIIPWHEKISD